MDKSNCANMLMAFTLNIKNIDFGENCASVYILCIHIYVYAISHLNRDVSRFVGHYYDEPQQQNA